MLIGLVPLSGMINLLVFLTQDSYARDNGFGGSPKPASALQVQRPSSVSAVGPKNTVAMA